MIVSLHPHFAGDINIAPRSLSSALEITLWMARAVVVPQGIQPKDYALCRKCQDNIFPNYDNRFEYEGKAGNSALFQKAGLPCPETRAYASAAKWRQAHPTSRDLPFEPPFVMKADKGGCGHGILLVRDPGEVDQALGFMESSIHNPTGGFVAQQWIDHGGRDLRVVLMGDSVHTYWRYQKQAGEFRNNVGRGAGIDPMGDPEKTQAGIDLVRKLQRCTGINLAAVDVMFDGPEGPPLLGEINFVFGRKGMGGSTVFRSLFNQAAWEWINALPAANP